MNDFNRVGYSAKINDPAFKNYIKKSNQWTVIFSGAIALIAVICFTVYGEISSEMDNPQSLFIGLGIGAMFLIIAAFQVRGRKKSVTWDGTVTDKYVKKKTRKKGSDEDAYDETYLEYTVVITSRDGKKVCLTAKDDDTRYDYFKIGDHVRHHQGLNTFEKYDKSGDGIIFCNACASLNDINEDYCFRCKCPLLK